MTEKINVTINNKDEMIESNTTVLALIQKRGLKKAAVWVNGTQLLKSQYETYRLSEGDEIRLLRIMAGG